MSEILFKCLSGAERSSPEQPIVLTIVVHSACLAGERMTKRTRFCLFFFLEGCSLQPSTPVLKMWALSLQLENEIRIEMGGDGLPAYS